MKFLKNTSGFTLLELMISMTIFAVMSIAILSIYIQTTNLSQKIRATRHLSETAREITERISDDVKQVWISTGSIDPIYGFWSTYSYAGGSEYIIMKNGTTYMYGRKTERGIDPCIDNNKTDPKIHCWLYRITSLSWSLDYTGAWNLIDSFIPEEEKKRVKVEDMKFYISGSDTNEKKVTLVFTLSLMPRIGVPPWLISDTRLHIETTISEAFYKK